MWTQVDTPVGPLVLVAADEGLREIRFGGARPAEETECAAGSAALHLALEQIDEYFAGKRTTFDVPLAPRGTPFQLAVWNALRHIAYGQTRSYADIARVIGKPDAVRAVGAANGANPIPIIIPCHRVIGSNGSLTGFGGGIDMKRRLLDFEAGYLTL
ncbi:MAG TPA: methylated-DNA--[protein]-cysteine S-methyltransferase [Thermoanaerobaculia bacterium]|nr:methylated-DNA--[protein]-cysteine S-methyltransferase [Thermoanaerobaculia bacterium]